MNFYSKLFLLGFEYVALQQKIHFLDSKTKKINIKIIIITQTDETGQKHFLKCL